MSKTTIQSLRGMRNILPPESAELQQIRQIIFQVLSSYGYLPWEIPLLEKTALFQRTIGDETDIVSKEMYTFNDRNGESLTLRPEGTAGVVRTMIEEGLLQQPQRLYVEGPMFRYERPQKGRYRQFTQVSVESFGFASPCQDVELIAIGASLFEQLGFLHDVVLEINTIGTVSERRCFQDDLVHFLMQHQEVLDDDCRRRLTTNPLRILDSKNPEIKEMLLNAPKLINYLGEESREHYRQVCQLLDDLGIAYRHNPFLVRGLDYYCHTVFEWTTNALGAQGTICAGGRYDGLVEQLGGKSTPAAGFAFGIDRILLLAKQYHEFTQPAPLVFAAALGMQHQATILMLCKKLRVHLPEVVIVYHPADQGMKAIMKKADQSGAHFAVVLGDDEAEKGEYMLKNLRNGAQSCLNEKALFVQLENEVRDV